MRRWLVISLCLVSPSALAQHGGGGGAAVHGTATTGTQGPIKFSVDKSRNAAADAARAKAVAGDCKAALDFFDEALRHSIDSTLYRDRGTCHEKLGNVYPAIDDYRAYLSQMPDAPDADKIRQRLADLVKDASQDLAMSQIGNGGSFASEMRGGMTDGSTPEGKPSSKPKKADDSNDQAKHPEDPNKTLDAVESEEARDRQAHDSPMRLGKGFVLGAFLYPRYVVNSYSFKFGQGIGVKLGYSLGETSSLVLELGYMNQLSSGTASSKEGFTTMFGYEARIPFDRWGGNQLLLGIGGGYENLTDGNLGLAYASFVVRGRAGYRHVFGPSLALDFVADGGLMGTAPLDAPAGTKTFDLGGFVGGEVLLSVGF